jgi:hypothetical protein
MYELGRSAKLHMADAERQIEIIKQNDEIIRLLGEVVRLLAEPDEWGPRARGEEGADAAGPSSGDPTGE